MLILTFWCLCIQGFVISHYLNGILYLILQSSQESPLIYCLLHKLFCLQSVNELKEVALGECEFTEEEFTVVFLLESVFHTKPYIYEEA